MNKRLILPAGVLFALLTLNFGQAQAQTESSPATNRSADSSSTTAKVKSLSTNPSLTAKTDSSRQSTTATTSGLAPVTMAPSVKGSGTTGKIPKWLDSSTISDSVITESSGNIGVGTIAQGSKLTVHGTIETTLGGYKFADGTIQATSGIPFVTRESSLFGNGTNESPLGIVPGGVNTSHLANGALTGAKIANGSVVRSLNGVFDNVYLAAGSNIAITPFGSTLTIAAPNALTSVARNATLTGYGTSLSPLSVVDPATRQQPVIFSTSFTLPPGFNACWLSPSGCSDAFTVPQGKRLVIQQLMATVETNILASKASAFLVIDGNIAAGLPIILIEQNKFGFGGVSAFGGSQQVTIYLNAGQVVSFAGSHNSGGFSVHNFFFYGYLVDAP